MAWLKGNVKIHSDFPTGRCSQSSFLDSQWVVMVQVGTGIYEFSDEGHTALNIKMSQQPQFEIILHCCYLVTSVMSDSLWPYGAHQAPLSMGFSRQEHWSGLPFPSPGDLPDPGIGPRSPASQADSFPTEPPGQLFDPVTRNFSRPKDRETINKLQ